ncbi:MAG: hypothetical protein SOT72_03595 [Lactobacillus amylovorus]|nr:hypothetical protein [Lactobacillus amylovorus]
MTFDLNNANSNLFKHLLYNIQMKLYQAHLLWINIPIALIVILISGYLLIKIVTAGNQDPTKLHTKLEQNNSFRNNLAYTLATNFKVQILAYIATVFTGIAILAFVGKATNSPYTEPATQITSGNLVINKHFGFNSNDNDVYYNNNKLILLGYDDDIKLISLNRTFNKITLKPISKTGKAYLRVLAYAKSHKNDMHSPNLTVALDKTTLTYETVNGNQTVVCYASNKAQEHNSNHKTVLHY